MEIRVRESLEKEYNLDDAIETIRKFKTRNKDQNPDNIFLDIQTYLDLIKHNRDISISNKILGVEIRTVLCNYRVIEVGFNDNYKSVVFYINTN